MYPIDSADSAVTNLVSSLMDYMMIVGTKEGKGVISKLDVTNAYNGMDTSPVVAFTDN